MGWLALERKALDQLLLDDMPASALPKDVAALAQEHFVVAVAQSIRPRLKRSTRRTPAPTWWWAVQVKPQAKVGGEKSGVVAMVRKTFPWSHHEGGAIYLRRMTLPEIYQARSDGLIKAGPQ